MSTIAVDKGAKNLNYFLKTSQFDYIFDIWILLTHIIVKVNFLNFFRDSSNSLNGHFPNDLKIFEIFWFLSRDIYVEFWPVPVSSRGNAWNETDFFIQLIKFEFKKSIIQRVARSSRHSFWAKTEIFPRFFNSAGSKMYPWDRSGSTKSFFLKFIFDDFRWF